MNMQGRMKEEVYNYVISYKEWCFHFQSTQHASKIFPRYIIAVEEQVYVEKENENNSSQLYCN